MAKLKTALRVAQDFAQPQTQTPDPGPVIPAYCPPLESEVLALSACTGNNLELARATMTARTSDRLARLRVLAADSAAQIDADLAAGQALLTGAAQAIADATIGVNLLASALTDRAGLLRAAAADSADLADAQAWLADEGALELSGEQLASLNTKVALLPGRIADNQAAAAAAVADIRAQIEAGGIDLAALVAEMYASTARIGASFFAQDRVLRSDIEAGYFTLPAE